MKPSELSNDELLRLMEKERRALRYAPHYKAYMDTKKHYERLRKEYIRRQKKWKMKSATCL